MSVADDLAPARAPCNRPEPAQRAPEPLTYTMTEAAERLGGPFTYGWLRGHLSELPHLKTGGGSGRGGRVGFTAAHLLEIVSRFEVRPATAPASPSDFPSIVTRRRRRAP